MKLIRRLRHQPSNKRFSALVALADKANSQRRWAEAAKAYADALAVRPDAAAIWVQYGHSLKEQGFLSQAERAYQEAAALDGSNADTHLQLGHLYKLIGNTEKAIAAFEAAHRRLPDMVHGRPELASLRSAAPDIQVAADSHLARQEIKLPIDNKPVSAKVHNSQTLATSADHVVSTLAEIAQGHGIDPKVPALFDPHFYFCAHPVVRLSLTLAEPVACFSHFCESGIELGLAINARDELDAAFYRETYLGTMPFTAENVYRHWLTQGIGAGLVPNRRRWLQSKLGDQVSDTSDVNLSLFAARTDPEAKGKPWHSLVEHFIRAAAEPGAGVTVTKDNVNLLAAIAAHEGRAGGIRAEQALALCQRLAVAAPLSTSIQLRYAQELLDRNVVAEAHRIYQEQAGKDGAPPMAFLRQSECEERLGLLEQAMLTSHRANLAYPGDQYLKLRSSDLARRYFGSEWDAAVALGRMGEITAGQQRVRDACLLVQRLKVRDQTQAPKFIKRVAIVAHYPLPQCKFYRIDQKAEQLRAAGFEVETFDLADGVDTFLTVAERFEAVIFFRVPALPDVIASISKAAELGLVTFYDIDDLIFDADYPGSFDSYAGRISYEEYLGLALAVPLFEQAIRLCDYGLASTTSLATAMKPLVRGGRVYVHPNALGSKHLLFTLAAPLRREPTSDKKTTLFYGSGTKANKEDFQTILEPALVEIVRRHGSSIRIILMGDYPDSPGLDLIAANVTILAPIWEIEAYWSILAEVDINLAVLRPSPLTNAKSEIKWLEAAMLGIPSVVSDTATYREVIQPGVTGLICGGDSAAWVSALDKLIAKPALRRRIGEQARDFASVNYGQRTMANNIGAVMQELSAERDTRPVIVIVNVFYPPQAIGGATRVVHDNVGDILAIAAEQFRLEVFTTIDGGSPYVSQTHVQDGVRVTGVGTPHHPELEYRPIDGRMGELFGAFLDRVKPDAVHFHCIQRLTAAIVKATVERNIPYLISAHDGWWISDHQFLLDGWGRVQTYNYQAPLRTLEAQGLRAYTRLGQLARALRGASKILAVSNSFAQLYRECGVERVVSCANGVSELPECVRQHSPDGRVRLGFIGGAARHKGFDLIEIVLKSGQFANLTLLVIDHAMQPGDYRHESWGSTSVEFQAKTPQDRVAELYARIDVLLAPSIWPESFGLVSREAVLSGCWVIASDRGSIGECVEAGKNGFVVDVRSPDDLRSALRTINDTPATYTQPPRSQPRLRLAIEQAAEIVTHYASLVAKPVFTETVVRA